MYCLDSGTSSVRRLCYTAAAAMIFFSFYQYATQITHAQLYGNYYTFAIISDNVKLYFYLYLYVRIYMHNYFM